MSGDDTRHRQTEPDPDRPDENEAERLARNWNEILQELRVTQTGTQILTGFLLTLAFQSRFAELDVFQLSLYLALVVGAVLVTTLGLAPVSMHRRLFRQGEKERIVALADQMLKFMLAALAVVLAGTTWFIFDVVLGRTAGIIAGVISLIVVFVLWLALPKRVRTTLPR